MTKMVDDDSDSVSQTEKMNRDIARSVRKSNAEAAKSTAEARKAAREAVKEAIIVPPVISDVVIDSIQKTTEAMTVVINEEALKKMREKMKLNEAKLARLRNINFNAGSPVIETKSDSFNVKGKSKDQDRSRKLRHHGARLGLAGSQIRIYSHFKKQNSNAGRS